MPKWLAFDHRLVLVSWLAIHYVCMCVCICVCVSGGLGESVCVGGGVQLECVSMSVFVYCVVF